MARVIRFYMREMRMEILIDVSVDVWCNCARVRSEISVAMSMQCVHAQCHVGVEYILLSLVALLLSWHVCKCAYDRVLTSEFYLRP